MQYSELIKALAARVPYSHGRSSCGYCGAPVPASLENSSRCLQCGSTRLEPFRTPIDVRLEWVIRDLQELGWIAFTYGAVAVTSAGRARIASTDLRAVLSEELATIRPPHLDPKMQLTPRERWAAHLQDLEEVCRFLVLETHPGGASE